MVNIILQSNPLSFLWEGKNRISGFRVQKCGRGKEESQKWLFQIFLGLSLALMEQPILSVLPLNVDNRTMSLWPRVPHFTDWVINYKPVETIT